jgi:hypothetical protein
MAEGRCDDYCWGGPDGSLNYVWSEDGAYSCCDEARDTPVNEWAQDNCDDDCPERDATCNP